MNKNNDFLNLLDEIEDLNARSRAEIEKYTNNIVKIKQAREVFLNSGEMDSAVRSEIADSWKRCRQLKINPAHSQANLIDPQAFKKILQKNSLLVNVGSPIIDTIYRSLKEMNCIIYLTDQFEHILYTKGEILTQENIAEFGLRTGTRWCEETIGTNAITLALRHKKNFQTNNTEHFCENHHIVNCATALIYINGEIIGTLTITFHKNFFSKHFLSIVAAGAALIEKQLLHLQTTEIINFTFDKTSEGILILDSNLNISKVNRSLLKIINCDQPGIEQSDIKELFFEINFQKLINNGLIDTEIKETFIKYKSKLYRVNVHIRFIKHDHIFDGLVIICRKIEDIISLSQKFTGNTTYFTFDHIITQDSTMHRIIATAKKVASLRCTILIEGKSGTGKELFAQSIHSISNRKSKPFIAVNCAALPADLVESELFGYERGAFTGALSTGKPGKFELANGGTIFLDEIGELPLNIQSKLLRILDNHKVARIGGKQEKELNIRVIAATNRSLYEEVQKNNFREDLYYRLNVMFFKIPSLQERLADIPLLTNYFLNKLNTENRGSKTIHQNFVEALLKHNWEGNIRELQNTISRAYYLCDSKQITCEYIAGHIKTYDHPPSESTSNVATVDQAERQLIVDAIKSCNGKIIPAAQKIKMAKTTIYRKIKKYKITPDEYLKL